MPDYEEEIRLHDAALAALRERAFKIIHKEYFSKAGLSTPNKIWKDANAKDNIISLN